MVAKYLSFPTLPPYRGFTSLNTPTKARGMDATPPNKAGGLRAKPHKGGLGGKKDNREGGWGYMRRYIGNTGERMTKDAR